MNNEQVYHPNHYNHENRSECWDEMIDISASGTAIFDLWSAYKYKYRAGTKSGNSEEQDKAKIDNYIKHAKMLRDEYSWEFDDEAKYIYDLMLYELQR